MDEPEVFPPGSRVRLRDGGEYIFLVIAGGYVVEENWHFHSSAKPMTSATFALVEPPPAGPFTRSNT